jgi:hypothetical protein
LGERAGLRKSEAHHVERAPALSPGPSPISWERGANHRFAQVTSQTPAQVNGPIEVFGEPAGVVIVGIEGTLGNMNLIAGSIGVDAALYAGNQINMVAGRPVGHAAAGCMQQRHGISLDWRIK